MDPAIGRPDWAEIQPDGLSDWSLGWAAQPSAWLADDNFDLDAFNASIITSAMRSNVEPPPPFLEAPLLTPLSAGVLEPIIGQTEDLVRQHWYTFIEGNGTGYDTPGGNPDRPHINDADRENLAQRLQQRITTEPLPSTDFLWARRQNLFSSRRAIEQINIEDVHRAPEQTWRAWSQAEEQVRLWAAVSILDAELSELLLSDALLRRSPLDLVSEDNLWMAPTAEAWVSAVRCQIEQSGIPTSPSSPGPVGFRSYVELESIIWAISDSNFQENKADLPVKFERALISFYDRYLRPLESSHLKQDTFCLQALWHSGFLSLLTDFDRLERAIGREGSAEAQRHKEYAIDWASSPSGMRCAVHAVLILHLLETLPLGIEPAIHVPRVLFRATIVWYCYLKFGTSEETNEPRAFNLHNFGELKFINVNGGKLLFESQDYQNKKPLPSRCTTACRYVDLLKRVGHWGLSQQLAAIGVVLLHGNLEVATESASLVP
nr:hypothetical protein ANI_1_612044 [Aspergillus niger CBS 513.88]|eukprot:XP_001390824.2 hypothetical protein ANI_1_612044 [Aspergillus niger CBS 513.88]